MDQVTIGQRIKAQREKKRLSLQDVADKLGVNRSSVMRWENGDINKIKLPFVEKLAQILETSPGFLMGYFEYEDGGAGRSCQAEDGCFLPVVEDVSLTDGLFAKENIIHYELANGRWLYERCFFCAMRGDSMAPRIETGDRLLVKQQNYLENGQLGLFKIDGQSCFIRELRREKDIALYAYNPYYPAMHFAEGESERIQIIGRILESQRNW